MVRVGVIDSGGPADDPPGERAMARAFLADGAVHPAEPDRLGHGTAVAAIIRRAAPGAAILHAQVFGDRPLTSAAGRRGAALVRRDGARSAPRGDLPQPWPCRRPRAAGARLRGAVGCGRVLVAAHPARGPACYPAAYPGVIAATGDARCGWDDISQLGPALFGAWCNSPEHGAPGMGGASLGAARIAGHLAAITAAGERLTGAAATPVHRPRPPPWTRAQAWIGLPPAPPG